LKRKGCGTLPPAGTTFQLTNRKAWLIANVGGSMATFLSPPNTADHRTDHRTEQPTNRNSRTHPTEHRRTNRPNRPEARQAPPRRGHQDKPDQEPGPTHQPDPPPSHQPRPTSPTQQANPPAHPHPKNPPIRHAVTRPDSPQTMGTGHASVHVPQSVVSTSADADMSCHQGAKPPRDMS